MGKVLIAIFVMFSLTIQEGHGHGGHADNKNNHTLCTHRPSRNKTEFEELTVGSAGFKWFTRSCKPNADYNINACKCIECKPQLWIQFDGNGFHDSSGNNIPITKTGKLLYLGYFDGDNTLNVSKYANQDLGTKLTIRIRFYTTGNVSNEEVLISNCEEGQLGSVEIALDRQRNEIIFRIESRNENGSIPVELRQPYKDWTWTNVILRYDGSFVTAHVEGIPDVNATLAGGIATRNTGMLIGSCYGRGFLGYIDDIRIYRCLKY